MLTRTQRWFGVAMMLAATAVLAPLGAAEPNPAPAVPRPAQAKIQFSDRSDKLTVPKEGFRAQDIQGPVRSQQGSAAPELPTPPPSTPPTYDLKKLQEYLDREKNWIFSTPEDFGKEPTIEEAFGVAEAGNLRDDKYTSRMERFLTEGKDKSNAKSLSDGKESETRNERGDAEAFEGDGQGLGSDFSLRFLLDQQRGNLSALDNSQDRRGKELFASPLQSGLLQSPFRRADDGATAADKERFAPSPTDFSRLIGSSTDTAKLGSDTSVRSGDSGRQYQPGQMRGPGKDIDSLIASTRETIPLPAGSRSGGLEALGGFNSGASASAVLAPAPVQQTIRTEPKPAVLPIPRRTTF